ncbi:AB hydrolase-1 domain-containing protein [Sphingomonas antarctica]|uniref:alpha/beta fold hydrolase n=1 Tax=Sphingomonas antarctica TaxID=2040274 RepID=UPI0039E93130
MMAALKGGLVRGGIAASFAAAALTGCGQPAAQRHEAADASADEVRPAKTGYVNVAGARFYYQVFGRLDAGKTPLLVLHGSFMSSEAMAPIIKAFAPSRPIIAFDARGHGRTGNLPGPFTYDQMAADAAGVLDALKVPTADVLGYSMGGVTAIVMAVRYPAKVGKQVVLSGVSERAGWYPEVLGGMAQMTPEAFAGGPLEAAYRRLSPTPDAFPKLVAEIRGQEAGGYDQPDAAVRSISAKTMIFIGDADGVRLDHALKLFLLRGGGDRKAAAQGFLPNAPRARLAVLPATSHLGMMAQGHLISELATPFLDDAKPVTAPGFMN